MRTTVDGGDEAGGTAAESVDVSEDAELQAEQAGDDDVVGIDVHEAEGEGRTENCDARAGEATKEREKKAAKDQLLCDARQDRKASQGAREVEEIRPGEQGEAAREAARGVAG